MRDYKERAKDFITQIFPYIEEAQYDVFLMRDMVKQFNRDHKRKVLCKNGLSRIALITSDYVVKYDYDAEEVDCIGGCEQEINLYTTALRDGFAYLFAEITRYEYEGKYFYIMPRIRGINGDRWDYADEFMTDEEQKWCDEHHLSDLHSNNYGFRKGKLCIVDYACSLEETSEYTTSMEVSTD